MQVAKLRLFGVPLLLFFTLSCNSSVKLWGKRTAHEKYADKIENTPEGKRWIAVSKVTLESPVKIQLPYRHVGHFPAGQPRALTLEFKTRQGEKIKIGLDKKNAASVLPYADLFMKEGTDIEHVGSSDTAHTEFSFDTDQTGTYLLRLQPELYSIASYDLSISVGPSLDFPVTGAKAKVGSYWGDDRDAGKRKHEGIDIFAPKLTPAIAAADGYITGVNESGIGGKTVWMRVADKNIHLYYAHLDKQLVEDGQRIKKGDTLGLVGNTGNAKFTPSHLHFGVYNYDGPVDPLPFVNRVTRAAPDVTAKNLNISLKKTSTMTDQILLPLAVTNEGYLAELPDGKIISAPFKSVKEIKPDNPVSQKEITTVGAGINSTNLSHE